MRDVHTATRKLLLVLLVVVMLTVTLGPGVASAATATRTPEGRASLDIRLCNYTVRPGDTLYAIARRFGTSVWYLATINHLANPSFIRSGQHLYVPCTPVPPALCWYRVHAGDNLSRIAYWYHTTVAYLASVNHIANPSRIYTGTWLRVPCWPDP